MTKKHFEALATALKASQAQADTPEKVEQWADDVKAVAGVLADSNERFDYHRFMQACLK